jgi:hypothetical protein
VLWTEQNYPETYPPRGIRYSRSIDSGRTWSQPHRFNGVYDYGAILALGTEQVHLFWSGTRPDRHEFHVWSTDRGETWSPVGQTSPAGGYFGFPSVASDSAGRIHLSHVTSLPNTPLVHQSGAGNEWSPPTVLVEWAEGASNHPSDSDTAVGLGNEIHVVVEQMRAIAAGSQANGEQQNSSATGGEQPAAEEWVFDIFYTHSTADAPRLAPKQIATPTPIPLATPERDTQQPVQTVQAAPTASLPGAAANEAGRSGKPAFIILKSVLAPLLLVAGSIIIRLFWKRRR